MKCSLFQCHSNYYYKTASLMLSDDEEFETCLINKRKKGQLYYLHKKAIDKIVMETKRDCHISSDHEKIEREKIKNDSEIDSEELDDINIILKKNNYENMFNKKNCIQSKKCVLPFPHNKNRVYSVHEVENKKIECSKKEKYSDKKKKLNISKCLNDESEMENEASIENVGKKKEDEVIEKFKEDLCNGLSNYFKDMFKNVENKENDMVNQNEHFLIKKLNISDDDGLDDNFDNDIFFSKGLSSCSLNFEDSLPLTLSIKKKKKWGRQEEPHVTAASKEYNLAIFDKKKKQEVEKLHHKQQHEQVEGSIDELDNYSLISDQSFVNDTLKKKKDECRQITNGPLSRFYNKNTPINNFQTNKYDSTKKRKTNNNNNDKNNNNEIRKRNKHEDLYYIQSNKKKEERTYSKKDESCKSPGKIHKLGVDRLEEVKRIRRKEILAQNDQEKKHFPYQNFNRTVENIVRNNEINNHMNILRNKKESKNMSIMKEFEKGNKDSDEEDFIFVHFQKNVNNKILNKFFL